MPKKMSPPGSPVRSQTNKISAQMPRTPDQRAVTPRSTQHVNMLRARHYTEQGTDDGFNLAKRTLLHLRTPEATEAVAVLRQAPQRLGANQVEEARFFALQAQVVAILDKGLTRLSDPDAPAALTPNP